MPSPRHPRAGRIRPVVAGLASLVASAGAVQVTAPLGAAAATPPSGVVTVSSPAAWNFENVGGPTGNTDTFSLQVQLPAAASTLYAPDAAHGTRWAGVLTVRVHDTVPTGGAPLSLAATDAGGGAVGSSTLASAPNADGSDDEVLLIDNPTQQTYTITASASPAGISPVATAQAPATATLRLVNLAAETDPAPAAGAPTYADYELPQALMPLTTYEATYLGYHAFGEPTLGVDPRTDALMYQAGLYTLKGTFGGGIPAPVSWVNASPPLTSVATLDAILALDRTTGRTFVSQLTAACSLSEYSDDDGATWSPSAKPCETPPAVDHQTIGGGPFASPLPSPGPVYPDATYYCSQNVAEAECALSLDGGITYGAASPMFTSATCFGLHGHIKVGPDGTAYVPDKACGAPECFIVTSTAGPDCHRGLAVSRDNGLTWTVTTVPDSHARYIASGDPSVAVGSAGTVYFGYDDRDGHPKVAVSRDHGSTWTASTDVSNGFHIENTQMPVMIAGDDNRAAFAFLGTATPGNDQDGSTHAAWYLYIATTWDGGATWTTVNATPGHPVQRGCIEFGGSCPRSGTTDQRNLLDFNDGTLDREGRVVVAYTDGCDAPCIADPARLSGGPAAGGVRNPAVIRQQCGRGLYAAFDTALAAACAAGTPGATATPVNASAPVAATASTSPNTVGAGAPGWAEGAGVAALGLAGLRRRRRGRRRVTPCDGTAGARRRA